MQVGSLLRVNDEQTVFRNMIDKAWTEVQSGKAGNGISNFIQVSMGGNSGLENFFVQTTQLGPNKLNSALDLMITNIPVFEEFTRMEKNKTKNMKDCESQFKGI